MQLYQQFSTMTSSEQEAWLTDYQQWLSEDFPKVEKANVLSAEVRTIAEQGLLLISAFPFCRAFVRDSLSVRDYHRRMQIIRRYADKITNEVQKATNTTVDLTSPTLLVPHRGRPTREEAAAKELLKKKKQEEEEKNSIFNQQTEDGSQTASFGPVAPIASAKMPTLAELRWLMSESLRARADKVRDLRSRAEEASTRAKQMAEDNRAAEDIKPFAQEAANCFEQVEKIYADVDREMATVYVRLKEDTAFIAEIAKVSKLDNIELRTWLRPYWDKLEDKDAFKQQVIDFIKANDPEQAAIRKAQEEKKQQVDDILKYLQRKDKPNTLKRLATMEERLKILHELLGEDANPYDVLLTAAREDYEQNVKPAEDAKKAERAAKAAEKKKSAKSKKKE